MTQDEKVTQWVIIEMMGHRRIAGRYSVENGLHRVDVPNETGYITKMLGNAAIYEIHFVDEDAARFAARNFEPNPIGVWEMREELKRLKAPAGPGEPVEGWGAEWEDDDE